MKSLCNALILACALTQSIAQADTAKTFFAKLKAEFASAQNLDTRFTRDTLELDGECVYLYHYADGTPNYDKSDMILIVEGSLSFGKRKLGFIVSEQPKTVWRPKGKGFGVRESERPHLIASIDQEGDLYQFEEFDNSGKGSTERLRSVENIFGEGPAYVTHLMTSRSSERYCYFYKN